MRKWLCGAALLGTVLACSAADELAIVGATVVDVSHGGRSSADVQDATILVRDGVIVQVGPRARVRVPRGARVIGAAGRYAVPGLIEGMGSLHSQGFADAYLYEGVTTVYVTQIAPPEGGLPWIAQVQGGPAVRRDGVLLDKKLMPSELDARLADARRRGVPVLGEFAATSYGFAIRHGVPALVRNDHYLTSLARPEDWDAYAAAPFSNAAGPVYRAVCSIEPDAPAVIALGQQLVAAHTALMPVLTMEATADDVGAPNPWHSPAAAFVTSDELEDPVDPQTGARPYLDSHPARREALRACALRRQAIDAKLHAMGVTYLAASGVRVFGVMPGSGLHQELKLLNHIGLTPREALAAATSNYADVFPWKDIGRIEAGRRADVLLLASDPRKSIDAVDDIAAVIHDGEPVDRAALLARSSQARALALVRQAMTAQGGERLLRGLRSVQWEASGYRNMVEQSERPSGPYVTEFDSITQTNDIAGGRFARITKGDVFPFGAFSSGFVTDHDVAMRVTGAGTMAGTPQTLQLARERAALSPERLLVTAADAADLRREADAMMQDVPQQVLSFTLDGAPVRIYLNAYTHLPTAVDYSGPLARSAFWSFLGDVTLRTAYSFWWLAKDGLHYPMQWDMTSNGLPDGMLHIHRLQIDEATDETALAIPPAVRAAYKPDAPPADRNATPLADGREIAPGIVFIPGDWNTTIVRQDDGIVILELPISSGFAARVLERARRLFPGLPVKAAITTSDAWPHLAGVRQFVAEGVPVYALDLNKPILERVLAMPYTSRPDLQQKAPRKPQWHLVDGKVSIGSGANRLELFPLRGETSERQMMAYFPAQRLLYGSDAFQRDAKGAWFSPQAMSELTDAVTREQLAVERFFMMHVDPTPWADLQAAIRVAQSGKPDLALQR